MQRNCAAYLKLRNWQWWRLFIKVREAAPTHASAPGAGEGHPVLSAYALESIFLPVTQESLEGKRFKLV
jgi:hypothetical protein